MIRKIREQILAFVNNDKDYPILAAFAAGYYSFIYFYSNNFYAINSIKHFTALVILFIVLPLLLFLVSFTVFKRVNKLIPYKRHLLFILIVMVTAVLLSEAIYFKLMKKALVVILLISFGLSIKLFNQYKKIIVLLLLMSFLPLLRCLTSFYDYAKPWSWKNQPDEIEQVKFVKTPNIYLIQPDGYVGQSVMEQPPYSYKSDLYDWLKSEDFKVYPNFRSNYPATLLSNASVFSMKHHYFGNVFFPAIEMINAREVICGNNPVISILKNNNYKTFLLASDEYFQQNYSKLHYDYSNILMDEIPIFSHGALVKKDVYNDLKSAFKVKTDGPKFFFIEKLEPHHVYLHEQNNKQLEERQLHLQRVEKSNKFIKETVAFIEANDSNAVIIINSDHGGYVGIENHKEAYSNNNATNVSSIFSTLMAIKWNQNMNYDFDKDLKTNVNLFRVLFSVLSKNKDYLNHLEDNSSYNLHYENAIYNSVYKVIDDSGALLLSN